MANLGKIIREEIAKSVLKAVRGTGFGAELRKIRAQLVVLEKRVSALEKAPARAAAAARRGRRVDRRKLRFTPSTLKGIRAKLGVTQQEMAQLLGVSGNAVWQWEAGRAKPRAGHLAQMRKLRGIGKREARRRLKK